MLPCRNKVPSSQHPHHRPLQAPKKLPQGAPSVARQPGVWAQKFLRAANHRPRSRGRKSRGARSTRQPWSAARKGGWWDPVRLLYDVKSSWSAAAAAGGLLHNRAASSPRASCLLRRLFRVGAFRPSKPEQASTSPPAVPAPRPAADSTTSHCWPLLGMAILHSGILVGFCAHWSETFRYKTRT